jgi:hypothetical protein
MNAHSCSWSGIWRRIYAEFACTSEILQFIVHIYWCHVNYTADKGTPAADAEAHTALES